VVRSESVFLAADEAVHGHRCWQREERRTDLGNGAHDGCDEREIAAIRARL